MVLLWRARSVADRSNKDWGKGRRIATSAGKERGAEVAVALIYDIRKRLVLALDELDGQELYGGTRGGRGGWGGYDHVKHESASWRWEFLLSSIALIFLSRDLPHKHQSESSESESSESESSGNPTLS